MAKFSERLKEFMQEKNLTQTALEEQTGIQSTNISDFLSDKHSPSYKNLTRLLYFFNCSADYLLGRADFPREEPLHELPPFHSRLREILKEHNVSQERLKRELPISGSALYKWVSGKSQPSVESLILLADYFDISIDYLIGRIQ